ITSNDGGVAISLSTWGSNLVTFSEQFVRAMNILNDFATSHTDQNGNSTIASFIGGLFDSLVNAFNPETIPLLSEIGAAIDEAVAEGMGSDEEAIRLGANRLTDALKNNINSETTLSVFRSAGDKLREHLTDKGFFSESSQARAEEVARLIRGKMSLQLSSKEAYDMFYNAGANLANGLIAGFNSKQGDAKTAATEMASSMNEAFTDAEIEHSPSRVWTGFGSNLVQGLINGVYDQTDNAISAVGYLAKAINGEIEDKSSLRITPVVDMNSASASATKLNNMFDSNRAAALSATMELNSQVTQIDQLVDVTNRILGSIQNGSDLYLDDRVLAGRINRRLGAV
ncbi:MAG: hypothetical protein IKH76_02805, partial [Clostridiales bacterium]|nr:hypothetical protein [Clostridiales bacterium]